MAGGEEGRQPPREAQVEELEGLSTQLVDLIRPALAAMRHATAALFGTDPTPADNVGAAYEALSTLRYEIEDHAAVLLAAHDRSTLEELPATIAAVHINAEAEHMGQLAREVAEIARTRRVLRDLSEVCLDIAAKASDVVESHGAVGVVELDAGDDEVDRLRQLLYWQLLSRSDVIDVGAAIDLTLAARCYERYAEHAAAVAHRGVLLAVGAPRTQG